ncbi:MAG: ribonuclease HI family protein [Deferribacteraceae bacterium]|jgi:ribonuclease HI|nr:ribonuclease HI family protein [Deferribacteraceae bacterium]
MSLYKVYSDGAARGNPGPAGAGFAVFDDNGALVYSKAIPLGKTTNNVAEYTALLEAAKYVKTLNPSRVDFLLDSELVVKQLAGQYKVKAPHLQPLYNELSTLLASMDATCKHVPREQNKLADKLANEGADQVKA